MPVPETRVGDAPFGGPVPEASAWPLQRATADRVFRGGVAVAAAVSAAVL